MVIDAHNQPKCGKEIKIFPGNSKDVFFFYKTFKNMSCYGKEISFIEFSNVTILGQMTMFILITKLCTIWHHLCASCSLMSHNIEEDLCLKWIQNSVYIIENTIIIHLRDEYTKGKKYCIAFLPLKSYIFKFEHVYYFIWLISYSLRICRNHSLGYENT